MGKEDATMSDDIPGRPAEQCSFVGEFIGRCTRGLGHGGDHWRSDGDAERWASGVWPVRHG